MSCLLPRLNCKTGQLSSNFTSTARRQQGFTLLELIVVILIVGLLLTFATLSVGTSADKQLETEAQRFASLMQLAAEEAIMNTQELALEVDQQGYRFLIWGSEGFQPIDEENGSVFRARELPGLIKLGAEIEEEKIDFESMEDDAELPKIGIFSSGEMTPFVITFAREDGVVYEVNGDYFGRIEYAGKVRDAEF